MARHLFKTFLKYYQQGADEILGVSEPKKFWMPWRMTQKRISRKISLAKYDFRKSGEGGGGVGVGVNGLPVHHPPPPPVRRGPDQMNCTKFKKHTEINEIFFKLFSLQQHNLYFRFRSSNRLVAHKDSVDLSEVKSYWDML